MSVEVVENPEGYPDKSALNMAFNNPLEERTCLNTMMFNDGLKPNVNGETNLGKFIEIKSSRIGEDTGAHEMGHVLGAIHSWCGLMTPSSTDVARNNNFIGQNIEDIIKMPLDGRINKDADGHLAGKGTVINNSKYSQSQLKKGNIHKKK